MPFGLKNAPAIFQRALHRIIRKHNLERFSSNYMDDILIYLQNPHQTRHLQNQAIHIPYHTQQPLCPCETEQTIEHLLTAYAPCGYKKGHNPGPNKQNQHTIRNNYTQLFLSLSFED